MYFSFKSLKPYVHSSSFVHPLAAITGCVRIGKNVYVGPFAALRGDFGEIVIEDGCNIQEHCMVHMFPGITVHLEENVHVGHGAIIHGARIGRNSLIGMNSVIMDDCEIGEECIVGAMSFIKERSNFGRRSLIVGNPAKKVKDVSDEMILWKTKGTELYQQLAHDCLEHLKETEPLREMPADWKIPNGEFKSWRHRD
jgi:phenylacetic acid degradation protein